MVNNKIIAGAFLSFAVLAIAGLFLYKKVNVEPEITVYKSATCGCCTKWIKHMEENGFQVNAINVSDPDLELVKQLHGISRELASCHTAIVNGYVIEGHVPALDVKRLLAEKPDVYGLSVPGMPVGSPGMEMGDRIDSYPVMSFDKNGETSIFNQY